MPVGSSESAQVKKIKEFLNSQSFNFISNIVESEGNKFFVSIASSYVGNTIKDGKTSFRQLAHLKKTIKEKIGQSVEFIVFIDEGFQNIESGLGEFVRRTFNEVKIDTYLSFYKGNIVDVYFENEINDITDESFFIRLKDKVTEFLGSFDMEVRSFTANVPEKYVPSGMSILNNIKKFSPVTAPQLIENLNNGGSVVPSIDWLRSRLDVLRKNGLILWMEGGTYCVTLKGLKAIPHPKSRISSDVLRILELGKKKW